MKILDKNIERIIFREVKDLESRLASFSVDEKDAEVKIVKRQLRDNLRSLGSVFKGVVDVFNAVKRAHKRAESEGHTLEIAGMRVSPHGILPTQIKTVLDLSKILDDVANSVIHDDEKGATAAETLAESLDYLSSVAQGMSSGVTIFDKWVPLPVDEVENSYPGPFSSQKYADPRPEWKTQASAGHKLFEYLWREGIPELLRSQGAKYIPKPLRDYLFDMIHNKEGWFVKAMNHTEIYDKYDGPRQSPKSFDWHRDQMLAREKEEVQNLPDVNVENLREIIKNCLSFISEEKSKSITGYPGELPTDVDKTKALERYKSTMASLEAQIAKASTPSEKELLQGQFQDVTDQHAKLAAS